MGAIASGGVSFLNDSVIQFLCISADVIAQAAARERRELEQREQVFGAARRVALRDRTVILVDDGLATGASMRVAVIAVRQKLPARVIVAVPVAARDACREMKQQADDVVCVQTPFHFEGVGQWYEDFEQTTDEEVRALLEQGAKFGPEAAGKGVQT